MNRVPDVTRLLDRMEDAGLVTRSRCTEDRRVVRAALTAEGRKRVDTLDDPVLELHAEQCADLRAGDLEALEDLLERLAPAE